MLIENIDFVICKLCNSKMKDIASSHLKRIHGINLNEYLKQFPEAKYKCENSLKKNNESLKAALNNPEYRKLRSKLSSGKNNGMYGKKQSLETKEKISKNKIGKSINSENIVYSEEYRNKISKGVKKAYKEGRITSPLKNMGNGCGTTPAELLLSKYLLPLGFKRELSIHPGGFRGGAYRLDFALESIKLDVEVDGIQHYEDKKIIERDLKRDNFLSSNGWIVIRFKNEEVLNNIDYVVERIKEFI